MLTVSLSESLNYIQNSNDYNAVLGCLIGKELDVMGKLKPLEIQRAIAKLYNEDSQNYALVKKAAEDDNENTYPIFYACYALIVSDIKTLNLDQLEFTNLWLQDEISKHPNYQFLLDNISAIRTALSYSSGDEIAFPENCYLNLAGASLPNANLAGQKLNCINLANADLEDANLRDAELKHAILTNACAHRADLQCANLRYSHQEGASFDSAKLQDAKMQRANLQYAIYDHANLSGAELSEVTTKNTSFIDSNMTGCILHNTYLDGNFEGANLDSADIRRSDLSDLNTKLNNVKLTNIIPNTKTRVFSDQANKSDSEHEHYLASKRALLNNSNIQYFTDEQLTSKAALTEALESAYHMLKDNVDFPFFQKDMTRDFIKQVMKLKATNPVIAAELQETAYEHPLFECPNSVVHVLNSVSKSIFGFFAEPGQRDDALIESDYQAEMRVLLSR